MYTPYSLSTNVLYSIKECDEHHNSLVLISKYLSLLIYLLDEIKYSIMFKRSKIVNFIFHKTTNFDFVVKDCLCSR